MSVTAAFDIGGSKIEFARVDREGAVTNRATLPTPHTNWGDFVAALRSLVAADGGHATRIGISIAGTTDSATGIAQAANVPVVNGHHLENEISAALGVPVRVGNDADCFALAEATVGAGRGKPIVFGAILGTGVGGGLVIGGRMVRGANGVTGEWGHGPILAEAVAARGIPVIRCGCGQIGCLDSYGSARGLERIHAAFTGASLTSHEITQAWHAGDADAARTVDAFVELIAGPLSVIVNTIGPWVIPVGGGLSSDPALLERIDLAVRARVLGRYDTPLVVPGRTRGASGLIGAAMLAEELPA
ncbi:ROK family protein [Kaistia sp. UC242_56]|jgi:N-acetylglucosamine kinase|uniref:ROK family protein n=1 Tax=Kaistia sp. UC242_56 TaxID=3374625 RepID=UPI00337E5331|nr:ROK family protein [Kaistia sp.]